jgi:hypothetical protein
VSTFCKKAFASSTVYIAFLVAVELALFGEQPAQSAIKIEAKSKRLVVFIGLLFFCCEYTYA